jgi:plastocyanin
MAFTWTIDINPNQPTPPRVKFSPNPLPTAVIDGVKQTVLPGDEIIWRNNDTVAHWPGLTSNQTAFIPNQIAPGMSSDAFRPTAAGTVNYICTLPGHENEKGTIVVSAS